MTHQKNTQAQTNKNQTGLVSFPLLLGASFLASLATGCGPEAAQQLKMSRALVTTPTGSSVVSLVPQDGTIQPLKIIGDNDLIPINDRGDNIPSRYKQLLNAFGRMSMGCTATHIGNGFVLSAGHCFQAPATRENFVDCESVTVEWGVRQSNKAYMVSQCEIILAQATNDDVDYAIFKVSPVPQAVVSIDRSPLRFGTEVTIFGHPQARTLEWSGTCTVLSPKNGNWSDKAFSHQCDTEPGNSGSTVIDNNTLKIVGIHDGGISPFNYGTYITNTPVAEYENYYLGREQFKLPDEGERFIFNKKELVNNANDLVLVELSREENTLVSFELTFDVEEGYDFVAIEDGEGNRIHELTGKASHKIEGAVAPVKVLFKSDASGLSKLVKISHIEYQ